MDFSWVVAMKDELFDGASVEDSTVVLKSSEFEPVAFMASVVVRKRFISRVEANQWTERVVDEIEGART